MVLEHVRKPHPACVARFPAAKSSFGLTVSADTARPPTRLLATENALLGLGTQVSEHALGERTTYLFNHCESFAVPVGLALP
jgi:hypothetical protein